LTVVGFFGGRVGRRLWDGEEVFKDVRGGLKDEAREGKEESVRGCVDEEAVRGGVVEVGTPDERWRRRRLRLLYVHGGGLQEGGKEEL